MQCKAYIYNTVIISTQKLSELQEMQELCVQFHILGFMLLNSILEQAHGRKQANCGKTNSVWKGKWKYIIVHAAIITQMTYSFHHDNVSCTFHRHTYNSKIRVFEQNASVNDNGRKSGWYNDTLDAAVQRKSPSHKMSAPKFSFIILPHFGSNPKFRYM